MILQGAKTARPLLLIELFNSTQQQTTNRKEDTTMKTTIYRDTIYIEATYQNARVKIFHLADGRWTFTHNCTVYSLGDPKMHIESGTFTDARFERSEKGLNVYDWYRRIFFWDTIARDLPKALTFEKLATERIRQGDDFCMYDYLGDAADSIVRERLERALDYPELITEGLNLPIEAETTRQREAIAEKIDKAILMIDC